MFPAGREKIWKWFTYTIILAFSLNKNENSVTKSGAEYEMPPYLLTCDFTRDPAPADTPRTVRTFLTFLTFRRFHKRCGNQVFPML
jgi:hypothetical protein